ncbi:hypothetical protein AB3Z07_21390 [Metabacillus halosaccharovorans]|uniref:hypothetical protein n=1 Tax=Metabacillus halosaccharovorans TaxID=930124 RepID=UPI0034CDEA97
MTFYNVYYDYFDGVKVPIWIVIDVSGNEIDWNESLFHFHVQAPFNMQHSEGFDPYALNISIYMNELTSNMEENHIGVNLKLVKKRLDENEIEYSDISNFVIQVADIEEILKFSIGD